MAYIKREKYTVVEDDDLKKELLDTLLEKGLNKSKAKQLVYYPTPMSLIRWSNYLEPSECTMFLEPYNNDEEDSNFGIN